MSDYQTLIYFGLFLDQSFLVKKQTSAIKPTKENKQIKELSKSTSSRTRNPAIPQKKVQ